MSSGSTRVSASEAMKKAEQNIKGKLTPADDVWFKACEAAGLSLEQLVPVQGERHLIASWAGVASGVRYAVKQLRDELDRRANDIRDRDATIVSLQKQLRDNDRKGYEQQIEVIGHRVGKVLREGNVDQDVAALVHEEMLSPAS